jgi:hypothetical protein
MDKIPRFAVMDIEASDWIKFESLGYFDGERYACFNKPFRPAVRRFLDYLDKPANDGLWIYAHNGGGYDFKFILEELLDRGWIPADGITDRNGRLIRIGVQTKHCKFQFVDSYALLNTSLKNLGITFEVDHQKTEQDYTKISARSKETQAYLENDCHCLFEVLSKWFAMEYVYKRKMTIASQAMDTFQTGFCHGRQERMKLNDDEYIRENFYSGGRVEVYKGFGTNLNYYDVNSLYPFAMLQKMPLGVGKRTKIYHKGDIGFYEVNIHSTPEWYISPLIVKGKKNCFASGAGNYYVSSNTLEQLRVEGVRWNVVTGLKFSGAEYLFTDYVKFFYKMKQHAKTAAERWLAKYLMNTLYGKFAQGQFRDAIRFVWNVEDYDFMLSAEYGLCYVTEENRNRFIMPYIAAWITDYARLYHYQLMSKHARAMYYCDTDSLVTTAHYKTGEGIGDLKLEGEFKEGVFLSPKTYALKNGRKEQVKFKGFDADNFTYAGLKKALVRSQALTEKRTRILGWKEALRRKKDYIHKAGKFLILVEMKKTTKAGETNRLHLSSTKHIFDTKAVQRKPPDAPLPLPE